MANSLCFLLIEIFKVYLTRKGSYFIIVSMQRSDSNEKINISVVDNGCFA